MRWEVSGGIEECEGTGQEVLIKRYCEPMLEDESMTTCSTKSTNIISFELGETRMKAPT